MADFCAMEDVTVYTKRHQYEKIVVERRWRFEAVKSVQEIDVALCIQAVLEHYVSETETNFLK
jgi:hypothetical protein